VAERQSDFVREDYLKTASYRRLPIKEQLYKLIEEIGRAHGLRADIVSGGQLSHGGPRTGSHRHDIDSDDPFGASDLKLFDPQQKRYLSLANPDDRPRLAGYLRDAAARGVTGIGAGREYMGNETFHIGGGKRATWGSEAGWLRQQALDAAGQQPQQQAQHDPAVGGTPLEGEREQIRQEARRIFAARGIDPNVAERVIQQESRFDPAAKNVSGKERSYGLAQLNEMGGLGAEALKRGIDPKDPGQWRQHLEFMADTVKRDGWRQWYGARDVGIGRWDGVKGPASNVAEMKSVPGAVPMPANGVPTLPTNVDQGLLAQSNPFQAIADEGQKAQEQLQQTAQVQQAAQQEQLQQLAAQPQAPPIPLAPQPEQAPAAQPADYAALMFPRVRRGLLADPRDYGGLLGGYG
jgi:Transglycosylase SLT domain